MPFESTTFSNDFLNPKWEIKHGQMHQMQYHHDSSIVLTSIPLQVLIQNQLTQITKYFILISPLVDQNVKKIENNPHKLAEVMGEIKQKG